MDRDSDRLMPGCDEYGPDDSKRSVRHIPRPGRRFQILSDDDFWLYRLAERWQAASS